MIGLGVLGLGNLLLVAAVGLGAAAAAGALEVDGDVLGAPALALAWFVSATRSTPARSRAPAPSCRARRSCSRR